MTTTTPVDAAAAEPLINDNRELTSYYESLESRIGYWLFLGGTRHFGYWEKDTRWPFPINPALRRMEEKLLAKLNVPSGSRLLDAGCGIAHVALFMAGKGLRVDGIDVIDHHIVKAKRNIARSGLPEGQVTVRKMDYHHLESIPTGTYDGMYTMETFVHATDPKMAAEGFFRILKPGGRIACFEYEHLFVSEDQLGGLAKSMKQVNKYAAMPTNDRAKAGFWEELLREAGFVDIQVDDYSENIRPMLRLFYAMAILPCFLLVKVLRLERYFVNTLAGAEGLTAQKYWRFVAISARKPE
jgi:sterol 24-C-methyltransferase